MCNVYSIWFPPYNYIISGFQNFFSSFLIELNPGSEMP